MEDAGLSNGLLLLQLRGSVGEESWPCGPGPAEPEMTKERSPPSERESPPVFPSSHVPELLAHFGAAVLRQALPPGNRAVQLSDGCRRFSVPSHGSLTCACGSSEASFGHHLWIFRGETRATVSQNGYGIIYCYGSSSEAQE